MTQDARTTESETRDNAAIREIMHSIRDRLTVPDRATLCLGLVGHLATLMNGRQMEKLLNQLIEEAQKVQDIPPARQAGIGAHASNRTEGLTGSEQKASSSNQAAPGSDTGYRADAAEPGRGNAGPTTMRDGGGAGDNSYVGQHGRGAVSEDRTPLL